MNCRKVTHLLSAYLDGELQGVESLQIRDHLRQCDECTVEYKDLLSMKRMLGRLKIQESVCDMPASILQNIRVDTELRSQNDPLLQIHRYFHRSKLESPAVQKLGLCVSLAVLIAVGFTHMQSSNTNDLRVVGEWDHSIPPASDFTSRENYPIANKFVPAAIGMSSGQNIMPQETFSSYSNVYRSPRQKTSTVVYDLISQH